MKVMATAPHCRTCHLPNAACKSRMQPHMQLGPVCLLAAFAGYCPMQLISLIRPGATEGQDAGLQGLAPEHSQT